MTNPELTSFDQIDKFDGSKTLQPDQSTDNILRQESSLSAYQRETGDLFDYLQHGAEETVTKGQYLEGLRPTGYAEAEPIKSPQEITFINNQGTFETIHPKEKLPTLDDIENPPDKERYN